MFPLYPALIVLLLSFFINLSQIHITLLIDSHYQLILHPQHYNIVLKHCLIYHHLDMIHPPQQVLDIHLALTVHPLLYRLGYHFTDPMKLPLLSHHIKHINLILMNILEIIRLPKLRMVVFAVKIIIKR